MAAAVRTSLATPTWIRRPSTSTASRSANCPMIPRSCIAEITVRSAFQPELVDELEDALPFAEVECGTWFVEQEHGCALGERAGEHHPLCLPAGELAEASLGERNEIETA